MIQTERLILRSISERDAQFLVDLMNTENWLAYIGDRKVYSEKDAINYIHERMHPDIKEKGFINHVMIDKKSKKAVGTCSLHDREGVSGMDIGYALLPKYEGKGYAKEGVNAMVDLAVNHYHQAKVSAITTDKNIGSCKVLEVLGFQLEKYIRLTKDSEKLRLYVLDK